tara:strand:- start:2039 stop:2560 length:522 start_codon:yes stop_codon:yes gene_type:complete
MISPEYAELNRDKHRTSTSFGTSGELHAKTVATLAGEMSTNDVLDYGCGKGTLQACLPFSIYEYDPCIPGKEEPPDPADLVACTDVMEHIEPEHLDAVLDDLVRVTKKKLYVNVSLVPALKLMPDGTNPHLIIETIEWWLPKFISRFSLKHFQSGGESKGVSPSAFTAILDAK